MDISRKPMKQKIFYKKGSGVNDQKFEVSWVELPKKNLGIFCAKSPQFRESHFLGLHSQLSNL